MTNKKLQQMLYYYSSHPEKIKRDNDGFLYLRKYFPIGVGLVSGYFDNDLERWYYIFYFIEGPDNKIVGIIFDMIFDLHVFTLKSYRRQGLTKATLSRLALIKKDWPKQVTVNSIASKNLSESLGYIVKLTNKLESEFRG